MAEILGKALDSRLNRSEKVRSDVERKVARAVALGGTAGDIASRLLEQLSDDDLARLGFEALIGRAQWAQAQIEVGQTVECL